MPLFEDGKISRRRLKITVNGLVQGIGFRPFVYRLAQKYQQAGWVANNENGVLIEIEGEAAQQNLFLQALQAEIPACGHIEKLSLAEIPFLHESDFQLRSSLHADQHTAAFVCADIAVCQDCLRELLDPHNRRYLHPFISCCHCGPRYSLMTRLPYDRCNTTLECFPLCPDCSDEYRNPAERRFHAQTIACNQCGPQLAFCEANGQILQYQQAALDAAATALQQGQILALKGIGGFQLLVDATNAAAVLRLRQRKHRPGKPFALMVQRLDQAQQLGEFSLLEQSLISSSAAPIVLVKARQNLTISDAVAPQQKLLGIMLAYSPLHHLLLHQFNRPVVATSGNQQDEPICIDNRQAFQKLAGVADCFLIHDRAILRPLDDSIVRVLGGQATLLRRARGYVPTPVSLPHSMKSCLAVGGHLKNTVAVNQHRQVILSQHLGDLAQLETVQQFQRTIDDLSEFYALKPAQVLCDLHPDYVSSQYAHKLSLPIQMVQHHYAHILSCMAEHGLSAPLLGIAWDGIGLGTDRQLWGGEFLQIHTHGFTRIAHLRAFPLIGGLAAIKEPRRVTLALLYAVFGTALFSEHAHLLNAFSPVELKLLQSMLEKNLHCLQTTSMGRLFDGLASLVGLCQVNQFEGQAAMAFEQAALSEQTAETYPLPILAGEVMQIDWQPLISGVLDDLSRLGVAQIAAKCHNSFAQLPFLIAQHNGCKRLVLSGGCFQNAYLVDAIEKANQIYQLQIFRHAKIPPNDGGLALGQIYFSCLNDVRG